MRKFYMFTVLLLIFSILLPVQTFAESLSPCKDENPQWRSCKIEKDCVIVSNPCGWPSDAAHQTFAEKAGKCNRYRGAAMGCPAYDAVRDGSYTAHCVVGKCVAVKDIP